ncbi:MAG: serine protease [Pseudomonadota bacterium]
MATGFVIGDGKMIATNAHVIPPIENPEFEKLVIFVGTGRHVEVRPVKIIKRDETHDLAILRQMGAPLPALKLAPPEPPLAEGSAIAFMGYPIGSVLGLYPVTHGGYLSAITPVVIPAANSNSLSAAQVRALKNPYFVYQLDATAYPGNSGSPLFDTDSGNVIGVINKVFVKSRKEKVLSDPSDITYAIPVKFLHGLMK